MKPRNVTFIKGNIWCVTFFKGYCLKYIYFSPDNKANPKEESLEKILTYPHLDKSNLSYHDILCLMSQQNIPKKSRAAKKRFKKEIMHEEEHY